MDRLAAFLDNKTKIEVFHSIQHRHELWKSDPFDVDSIHAHARDAFARVLDRALSKQNLGTGRMLLLLGDSGCGKTHLVRACRTYTHEREVGFVGYLQMTTMVTDYPRYVLSNLIESLQKPYSERTGPMTGLQKLSLLLANRAGDTISKLEDEGVHSWSEIQEVASRAADVVMDTEGYHDLDIDLVRAMLLLRCEDVRLHQRVLKYLRCEQLSPADREVLGGMVPRQGDDAPMKVIEFFGKLGARIGKSLVLSVDQIEDAFTLEGAEERLRQMVSTLCAVADLVPSSVIVLCCLEQYWTALRGKLTRSLLDRVEHDPEPVRLEALRSPEEAERIIGRRMQYLCEMSEVDFDDAQPTHPIPVHMIHELGPQRTRDLLDRCREFRARWSRSGSMPSSLAAAQGADQPAQIQPAIEQDADVTQRWNDFRASFQASIPDNEVEQIALFQRSLAILQRELPAGVKVSAMPRGQWLEVDFTDARKTERLLMGLCNRGTRGGGLGHQLSQLEKESGTRTPVVMRSLEFPANVSTQVGRQLGEMIGKRGARRVQIEDADWRTMLAVEAFLGNSVSPAARADWLRAERPLSRLAALSQSLDLESLEAHHFTIEQAPERTVPATEDSGAKPATLTKRMLVGTTDDLLARQSTIELDDLVQHVAVLGSTGSGKTTLALRLIEQALTRGIPVVMVDRKGDLAGYADPSAWQVNDASSAERSALRERLSIAFYTPGDSRGRQLAIPLLPGRLNELDDIERDEALRFSGAAIAGALGYRDSSRADKQCKVFIQQALQVLDSAGLEPTLERLIHLVAEQDNALIAAIGRLDVKLLKKLAEDLETFRLNRAARLLGGTEMVDPDRLFARGPNAQQGRAQLSIISTKFLADQDSIQFWMTQFLSQLARWTSRNPSPELQALILFDEADVYLPAVGKPSTKEPMESLLKRARAAGLGIMLATQSPGDFDYKCRDQIRTWFVGRIKEETALRKLRPMLADHNAGAIESKLARQGAGHFHLINESGATAVHAEKCLVMPKQLSESKLLELACTR